LPDPEDESTEPVDKTEPEQPQAWNVSEKSEELEAERNRKRTLFWWEWGASPDPADESTEPVATWRTEYIWDIRRTAKWRLKNNSKMLEPDYYV